jgi:hypothetical protein
MSAKAERDIHIWIVAGSEAAGLYGGQTAFTIR